MRIYRCPRYSVHLRLLRFAFGWKDMNRTSPPISSF
ncbi:hypothetical protein M2368_001067 [Arthrobacter sp. JUb119]|nr:hypothetical protein [Arthrobacter sp. JUb119]